MDGHQKVHSGFLIEDYLEYLLNVDRLSIQAMKMFIEASETHESEISQMFLPTDNPLFFQLKVHSEIDYVFLVGVNFEYL